MSLKLDQKEAVNIVIALINQGKIELPCLKEFNEFRGWEINEAKPNQERIENQLGFDRFTERNELCRRAALLDAEYLRTFIEVLTNERNEGQISWDAWEFVNNLRKMKAKIESDPS